MKRTMHQVILITFLCSVFIGRAQTNTGKPRSTPKDKLFGCVSTRAWMDLIGHMRPVVIAGIDVVHSGLDRLPQNSNGGHPHRVVVPTPADRQAAWIHSPCGLRSSLCPAAAGEI